MVGYEFAILYDPDLEVDLEKAESSVKNVIKKHGGVVVSSDNWGKRRLAYKINQHENAIYVFYEVELDPKELSAVNDELNITGEVVRFLITRPDLKKKAKAEIERAEKLKKNASRTSRDSDEEAES